jgi:hypothetical protein
MADKKVEAYKMGKGITWQAESQDFPFLRKDEGFAGADGHLSNENLKPEFFQNGSSMIMIAHAGATT